jgi:hypothetical protein
MSLKVPVALWNGKPVFPRTVERCQNPLRCPQCNKKVVLRRGALRVAHFSHQTLSTCAESLQHYATKHWIAANVRNPAFTIHRFCGGCGRNILLFQGNAAASCTTEYRVQVFGDTYVVDAMIFEDGHPLVCVEVYYKHRAGFDKMRRLALLTPNTVAVEINVQDLVQSNYSLQYKAMTTAKCRSCCLEHAKRGREKKKHNLMKTTIMHWQKVTKHHQKQRQHVWFKKWVLLVRVRRLVYWITKYKRNRFKQCAKCKMLIELYRIDNMGAKQSCNFCTHHDVLYHSWCLPTCQCGAIVSKIDTDCADCKKSRRPCHDCGKWKLRHELNGFYVPTAKYDTTFVCVECRVRCRSCSGYISQTQAKFGGKCYGCNLLRKLDQRGDCFDSYKCHCGRDKPKSYAECYNCAHVNDHGSASESESESEQEEDDQCRKKARISGAAEKV